ncbi:MAG: FHA domain-containing protein [Gammaproteobacteria bacterium]|nr:FHA domain-containing protein [Gammaproteobacteria bacterium]
MEAAKKYAFEKDIHELKLGPGAISLGRSDNNDINITDRSVSGHHARIFTYFNTSYIEDLDSTNGTFLNDKRIHKHIIHPGDTIRLGNHTIKITAKDEWPFRYR